MQTVTYMQEPLPEEIERQEFEEWAITQTYYLDWNGVDQYCNLRTHRAWLAWKAARVSPAKNRLNPNTMTYTLELPWKKSFETRNASTTGMEYDVVEVKGPGGTNTVHLRHNPHRSARPWVWETLEGYRLPFGSGNADTREEAKDQAEAWLVANTLKYLKPVTGGIDLISRERRRQIQVEGWTPEHDDSHTEGQMIIAAVAYALAAHDIITGKDPTTDLARDKDQPFWPWDREWWRPSTDAVRNLAKAGALLAAEICRLLRPRK